MVRSSWEDKRPDSYFHSSFPDGAIATESVTKIVENQWKYLSMIGFHSFNNENRNENGSYCLI